MGTYSGPLSIPDGLVYHIDPANTKSYPGTGLTFYDLVTGGIGGTLTNGPTYDVSSKGGFYFDGVDDYAVCGRREDIQGTNITLSVWARFYSLTSGDVAVCFGWTDGVNWRNGNGIGSYGGYIRSFLTSLFYTGNLNDWYHIAIASSGGTNNLYINGIGVSSTSSSFTYASTNLLLMGWGGSGYGSYGKFTLGSAKIFNRGLTALEVSQEYNATKKRYLPEENIVPNGLVLNIDPAKYSSYPGSGTTIYDLSGSGNTGVLTNGPTLFGLNGGSILLDGSNDYIEVPSISLNSSFTIDMFCNTNNISSTYVFVGKYGGGSYDFWLGVSGSRFKFSISMPNKIEPQTATISTNTWYHVAAVYNASSITASIYLNGVLAQTSSGSSVFQNPPGNYAIGAFGAAGGYYFPGNVAAHKLYNRALSASEIAQNFNALRGRYNI